MRSIERPSPELTHLNDTIFPGGFLALWGVAGTSGTRNVGKPRRLALVNWSGTPGPVLGIGRTREGFLAIASRWYTLSIACPEGTECSDRCEPAVLD